MEILQEFECQDSFSAALEIPDREGLVSMQAQAQNTNSVATITFTIQHVDPTFRTPSFKSTKVYCGSDGDMFDVSDSDDSVLPPRSVDEMAFREGVEKWIWEVEKGEWEEGMGGGVEMGDEGVVRKESERGGRGERGWEVAGDDEVDVEEDRVRRKRGRMGEREVVSDGVGEGREMEIARGLEKESFFVVARDH